MSGHVIWETDARRCSHTNDHVCRMCDFDGYYAHTYPDCPWRDEAEEVR